jgi:CheY-like chemotaxis protein
MKRVPLRRRLLFLVATGLLPVALLSAAGLHALYQEQREQTERTARRLAELHGGCAAAYSEGENRGSEFVVRLPAIPRPATVLEALSTDSTGRRSVLVVEDNEDGRESLRMLLEAQGHDVDTACDGPIGPEKALSLGPEIALVDIGLPGLDGYELARRLREAPMPRRIFLVAVTGCGAPEDRDRAFAAGFDAHVAKPVDRTVLATLLASAARVLDSAQESPSAR